MTVRALLAVGVVAFVTARVPPLASQQARQGRSEISGAVITNQTRRPVPNALIRVHIPRSAGDSGVPVVLHLRTDSTGEFHFRNLARGSYLVSATYRDYVSPMHRVDLAETERVELEFGVGELPPVLPEILVEGTSPPRIPHLLRAFYERAELGLGQFLMREDLDRFDGQSLANALRGIPGLRVACAGGTACRLTSLQANPLRCDEVAVWLDGVKADPSLINRTPPTEVEGVEYFGGASTTPQEYRKRGPDCGTLLIWTKRGPDR